MSNTGLQFEDGDRHQTDDGGAVTFTALHAGEPVKFVISNETLTIAYSGLGSGPLGWIAMFDHLTATIRSAAHLAWLEDGGQSESYEVTLAHFHQAAKGGGAH